MSLNKNKRKNSKRNRNSRRLKFLLYKIHHFITSGLLGFLTISIIIVSLSVNFFKKNTKNNTENKVTSVTQLSDTMLDVNNNDEINKSEVEDDLNKTRDIHDIEEIKDILQTDSYLVLEIAYMLEKFDLTYQDLLKYVSSVPEYNKELQSILDRYPNIDSDKLIGILQGITTKLRENLFIGDSRTQGMLLSGVINEETTVYGVGYGYNWLVGKGNFTSNKTNALNGAISDLEAKMSSQELYNIIIWLGVNDYTYIDANKYFKKFEELATDNWSNYNIYIVSVGPVKDNDLISVNNAGINSFNDSLKELVESSSLNNLKYIDLNLSEDSINKYDYVGLHYSDADYQNIYNIITDAIANDETDDVNSILSVFYCVLKSCDNNFNYTNETDAKIKKLENKIGNN